FFRTGASGAFRELRGQPVAGGFVFTIAAADTTGPFIQYYFTLSAVDSVLGSISVSIKDGSSGGPSGGSNDFVVAPASAPVPAPVP
ncbi:MAG TPA: hypothetical protein PKH40_12130, partial [Treponemataceae bacterium]|nr:hypothetical protein [Treponemataceae bacterium]